jgi:hypothetical protein
MVVAVESEMEKFIWALVRQIRLCVRVSPYEWEKLFVQSQLARTDSIRAKIGKICSEYENSAPSWSDYDYNTEADMAHTHIVLIVNYWIIITWTSYFSN